MADFDAVLLIAFGGPTRPEEVRPFLANVTRGRPIPADRLEVVAHHYDLTGGRSPLNDLTVRQARALEDELHRGGLPLPVAVGMRNWHPLLHETLAEMATAGRRRAVGVILSAQQSEAGWGRYVADVAEARATVGPDAPEVVYAPPWHDHPLFVDAVAARTRAALDQLSPAERAAMRLVFTAHSIPVAAADGAPYVAQVRAGASQVAARVGVVDWQLAYQSRSGNPRDPWLEPDIGNVIHELARQRVAAIVVVPIGFVCDHVEVLYDLDIEARGVADAEGVRFVRAAAVNDHPLFIGMLADLVRRTVQGS